MILKISVAKPKNMQYKIAKIVFFLIRNYKCELQLFL